MTLNCIAGGSAIGFRSPRQIAYLPEKFSAREARAAAYPHQHEPSRGGD
jgi:hypothetical protein